MSQYAIHKLGLDLAFHLSYYPQDYCFFLFLPVSPSPACLLSSLTRARLSEASFTWLRWDTLLTLLKSSRSGWLHISLRPQVEMHGESERRPGKMCPSLLGVGCGVCANLILSVHKYSIPVKEISSQKSSGCSVYYNTVPSDPCT